MIHLPTLNTLPIEAQVTLLAQVGSIAVAIVTVLGGIAIALLNRTRQHAKAAAANSAVVKDEVKNDHSTNFREENDERHAAILGAIEAIKAMQRSQGREIASLGRSVGGIRDDIRGMREDDRQVRAELDEERGRIRALEDTQPHRGGTRRKT